MNLTFSLVRYSIYIELKKKKHENELKDKKIIFNFFKSRLKVIDNRVLHNGDIHKVLVRESKYAEEK